jgi:hypothetical protein
MGGEGHGDGADWFQIACHRRYSGAALRSLVMAPAPASSNRRRLPPQTLGLLGSISAASLLLLGLPARAGSATAESIWDRSHALQEAMQQVPAGATVTDQRCQELEVGLDNFRYRCTVEWRSPAPQVRPDSQP